jgi:predicted PurR-regulated permease PerM
MQMQNEKPNQAKWRVGFLLMLAVGITALLFWVVKGFALALVMAAILAGFTYPAHRGLAKRLGGRKGVAAALTVLLALVVVIVPGLLLLGVLLHDAVEISERVQPWLAEHVQQSGGLRQAIEKSPTLSKLIPYQEQILEKVGQLAGKAASFAAESVVSGATGAAQFFLRLFVTLYAMFCFLKDGPAVLAWVFAYTPLSADDRQRLVATFASVARATLKGTFVIAIVQGALAGAAFAVAGIEGAVFWGALTAVSSVVPVVGTALVWVPAAVYLALSGRPGAAVGLAAWCVAVVGTVDNVLRPILVGKDTQMPDLMVLVTTLGGLALFGGAGIVIGPIVGALFTTVWTLWQAAVDEAGLAPLVNGAPGGRVSPS